MSIPTPMDEIDDLIAVQSTPAYQAGLEAGRKLFGPGPFDPSPEERALIVEMRDRFAAELLRRQNERRVEQGGPPEDLDTGEGRSVD